MTKSLSEILRTATEDYLKTVDPVNLPSADVMEAQLLAETRSMIIAENATRQKSEKPIKLPERLDAWQIARVIVHVYHVRNIAYAGFDNDSEYDLLAIYRDSGPDEGLYVSDESTIRNIAREYDIKMTQYDFSNVKVTLSDMAERVEPCHQQNLIAVNNGIFDYDTKVLMPFSPDLVFTSKSRVDYNPYAINPVLVNPDDLSLWDIESWMHTLSDDDEVVELLWQILGAIIRPNVPWNKSAWFYSENGNNGKGTLCELMRRLCGTGRYASIPLASMGDEFALEPLVRTSAIIVDENDVGMYIDKASNLKAIITNDVILINRKFKQKISYRHFGFMVQCLNEMPRIKDKTDSFFRRQLFVPFTKCFTGQERKYIKRDYLHRQDVLEYVLYRVLNMHYYELSEPSACKLALEEYREYNDPIRLFADEVVSECVWELLPNPFLYDLYRAWFERNIPSGQPLGRQSFLKDVKKVLVDTGEWKVCDTPTAPGAMLDKPERLILEYNLRNWMNLRYNGSQDPDKLCTPKDLKSNYRGFRRIAKREDNTDGEEV